jgi:sorbitol-6-phosphate 2-dehydrogenase
LAATPLISFSDDEAVRDFMSLPNVAALCRSGPTMPDQYVYAYGQPLYIRRPAKLSRLTQMIAKALGKLKSPLTRAVLVEGLGLFCAAPNAKPLSSVRSTMNCSLRSMTIASDLGGYRGLARKNVEFLERWEVEHFRRKLARGDGEKRLLDGKVAVVTGAGSGFGKGIYIELAKAGAYVALVDIDLDAAEHTAETIAGAAPGSVALPTPCDVTSEEKVDDAFAHVLETLGGLDIMVNAAGIAPPYRLEEFPLGAWRKTLEINLTGYFLTARAAARVFRRQGTGGSIVNLTSKTGLEVSKSNSAYNATKAGEIHLARGWALELADCKVRVNCVAPGNVFEGSKIWNPEYIRACARKRDIKSEEVIPYYIGLTALKEDITWKDVGNAVVFLCSDMAAKVTGQVIVVDAGQVMVR